MLSSYIFYYGSDTYEEMNNAWNKAISDWLIFHGGIINYDIKPVKLSKNAAHSSYVNIFV